MKPIFATASALALMLSAAACTDARTNDRTANDRSNDSYATTEQDRTAAQQSADSDSIIDRVGDVFTGNNTDDVLVAVNGDGSIRQSYVMAADEMKASTLIGASVHNAAGENIAKVSDVWLGANGGRPLLIVRNDNLMGLGGQRYAVGFDEVTVSKAAVRSNEPAVMFKAARNSIETLPEFIRDEQDQYSLASEMMGATADFTLSDGNARIDDLILSTDGEARYAIISAGRLSSSQIVINADAITRAQGDSEGELVISLTEDVFDRAKAYREQ